MLKLRAGKRLLFRPVTGPSDLAIKGNVTPAVERFCESPAANIYLNEQERLAGVLKQHHELS